LEDIGIQKDFHDQLVTLSWLSWKLERKMKELTGRKWFYPLGYFVVVVISMLPPLTELPYDPRHTQDVVMQILMVSITPYQAWGWVFHVMTLVFVAVIYFWPEKAGRPLVAYFGFNYLIIAALQTNAFTEDYGFAIHTGSLIAVGLIGVVWLIVSIRGEIQASFQAVPRWRWLFLPFALLVFWSPLEIRDTTIIPNFDPLLLLTSADYGLTYCFMTPVFLFLLILFYPKVNDFAFRVTAFNGLIYGILNLSHWFSPERAWMGVMHIPLLVIPLAALWLARKKWGRRLVVFA
jgi:hypothetical protein